ncbi:MAG: hypothetical protein GXP62_06735, partial [Oligoflexia bacterium]|nr:hypothetical protein [Oligoflexia bacterium]
MTIARPAVASWARALKDRGLAPRIDEPLARHGFWRIGGPADLWVEVPSTDDLRAVMALRAPLTVMGKGSNLLVADAGIRGITVKLTGELREAKLPGTRGEAPGEAPGEEPGEEPVAIVG